MDDDLEGGTYHEDPCGTGYGCKPWSPRAWSLRPHWHGQRAMTANCLTMLSVCSRRFQSDATNSGIPYNAGACRTGTEAVLRSPDLG